MKKYPIKNETTQFGFQFGASEFSRGFSTERDGGTMTQIKTEKHVLDVYVTRTGKIRIFEDVKGKFLGDPSFEWKPVLFVRRKPVHKRTI